jgi:putative peptide zinc metalloprotease protein
VSGAADLSTHDISVSPIKLSDELIFTPQAHGIETYYHIEAPSQGRFYRVGYPEYVFISLLDGGRTVVQALTVTARTLGEQALSQSQGMQVANWLIQNKLAQIPGTSSAWSTGVSETDGNSLERFKRLNPFWMKLPLGSPDRILTVLLPAFGWLCSPWALLMWLTAILAGTGCVISHWDRFVASATTVLTPHNWLWIFLAWLLLKIIHELSHALACKYHRGEVRDVGVIFILFAPMAYVDVTSCWRFPSRWQRIHVASAGMVAELVVAAIAAIVWVGIDSSILHHLLFNLIVMASFSTITFNANPLMRFDGYYILADLLKIPNLATDANRALKNWAARLFLGESRQPLQELGFRRWFICGYGLASAAWRLLICVSLITAAAVLFQGAGLLIAVAGVISWFGVPVWKIAIDLQRRLHENRPSFIRAIVISATLATVFIAGWLWVPWPGAMQAPVVVEYSNLSVIRSTAAGFIRDVHVADGQMVEAGQILVEIVNDQLSAQRRELEIAAQQGRVRYRVAVGRQDGAEAQIAQRNLQATEERLAEVYRQSSGQLVRAPVSGRIVARNLVQRVGSYVQEGAELLTVADESRKELVISIGQEEIDSIMPHVGEPIRFRVGSRMTRAGRLDRLDPRASTALPHPALSASVGGPLAVTEREDGSKQAKLRLVEPRFRGVINLTPDVCRDLGAGEQGYAILGLRRVSIGAFVGDRFHRWFEYLLRPAIHKS